MAITSCNHDQRESGSERPFSFASFLFLRGCVGQARKKRNSNRLRGSSRCGIRPPASFLHRNEGATGFLRLACAAGSAVARVAVMLLTSGSESYRAADAEALSTLNWCTISRTAGYTPLVTQYTSKNNVATDKPGAAGGRGPARPSEAAHGPARAAREGPRGEESAKQAKARSRSRKRNAPSISHRGSDSTLTQK